MSLIDRCAQCDAPMGYRRSGHSLCDKCRDELPLTKYVEEFGFIEPVLGDPFLGKRDAA